MPQSAVQRRDVKPKLEALVPWPPQVCAQRWVAVQHKLKIAAEITLEHHLGITYDPVKGSFPVCCIERNEFGAIKAVSAASLAPRVDA